MVAVGVAAVYFVMWLSDGHFGDRWYWFAGDLGIVIALLLYGLSRFLRGMPIAAPIEDNPFWKPPKESLDEPDGEVAPSENKQSFFRRVLSFLGSILRWF